MFKKIIFDKNKLFKFNKKINGKINLSTNKIFSRNSLIDSFESKIQFMNGNLLIDRLLLNLGKLGAADLTGVIENDEKMSNFKFESNIFIDNSKRFFSKFGIYDKEKEAKNLFLAGNFDLLNFNFRINEIFHEEKMKEDDTEYIEREFNELLLKDDYVSLFDFSKFKEFMKSIINDTN